MDIELFRSSFHGQVLEPANAGYNEARQIWNASVSRHPRIIARCSGVADVIAAVQFGRANLVTSIRGGGHNVGGRALCDDGLVIDLSRMRSVFVDEKARRVRVQGGATLGDIDRETHVFGLAVPCGIVPKTGIGGLTLGGGVGWLIRKYGMSIDNLLSSQVVTADGKVLNASALKTTICSGRYGAGAEISALLLLSSSKPTRWQRFSAVCSSTLGRWALT